MQQGTRYRLDRYYQINCAPLASCFCQYLTRIFVKSNLAPLLNELHLPNQAQQRRNIIELKSLLKKSAYKIESTDNKQESGVVTHPISIMPLVGYGRRKNS
eukprot:TRINITY_DN24872_c0_g1_i1.p1 TRINITY_DN24872_c0_g1~~TRINITY_DN24872_c0_g1_i1.p1  ORF type:complete len:101 (+),score=8.41 TRINITY_DN24872_c0_g1_i1:211-513(+)